jgi:UDP-N-acetylmuramoyl-L-alanyl-D-glutamate--2,6-diaminopimelate ligase
VVPGRVEVIQAEPFTVVVDYAYEPEEMRQLYETVRRWPHKRILQILGPTGGGRDKARIPLLGKMAGEFADLVFITIDDPYDDDPQFLNQQMAQGALGAGKIEGQSLFKSLDRREAVAKAFSFAEAGDLVLITGKGADQKIALANGKYVDWDDRKVAKHELGFLKLNKDKKFIKGW